MKTGHAILAAGAMIAIGIAATSPGQSQGPLSISPSVLQISAEDNGVWVALSSGEIGFCRAPGPATGEDAIHCVRTMP